LVAVDAALAAALAIVLAAGLIFGLTGFGFALISVPVLLLVYDPATVVMLTMVLTLFTCALVILDAWKAMQPRIVLMMLPGAIAGLFAGARVLALAEPDTIKLIAGAVVVTFSLLMLRGVALPGAHHGLAPPVAGGLSGLLATSTGLSSPPAVMLLTARAYARDAFRVNMSLYFVAINVIGLGVLAFQGLLHREQFVVSGILLPVTLLGTITGAWLSRYVPPGLFRRITLVLLMLTGAIGMLTALSALVWATGRCAACRVSVVLMRVQRRSQGKHGPVYQLLDATFGPAHQRANLLVGQSMRVFQHERPLLILAQPSHRRKQLLARRLPQHGIGRIRERASLIDDPLDMFDDHLAPANLAMPDNQVTGYPIEPGAKRQPSPLIRRQRRQCLLKGLGRQVFSLVMVADPPVNISVDLINIALVERAERRRISLSRCNEPPLLLETRRNPERCRLDSGL
jgi:uncharacterized membrane protein YfcA